MANLYDDPNREGRWSEDESRDYDRGRYDVGRDRDWEYGQGRNMPPYNRQNRFDYDRNRDFGGYGQQGGYGSEFDRDRDYGYGRSGYEYRGYGRGRGYGGEYGRDYGYGQMRSGMGDYGTPYGRDFNYGYGSQGEMDFDEDYEFDQPVTWTYTEIWLIPGPFTGQGPRAYQRSDSRIHEDVSDRLMQHGQVDASDITVEVKNSEVTLRGTVPDRKTKRMVEDTVETVSGVRDIHNEIKVQHGQREQQIEKQGMGAQASQTGSTGQQQTTAQQSRSRSQNR